MKYKLESGKTVTIPDNEIEISMKNLELTKEEAIEMWLEDNEYLDNEEQNELNEKASKVKISRGAKADEPTEKTKKPRTVKISDEKQTLFNVLLERLAESGYNAEVVKDNKLIQIAVGGKVFKLDLIETRKK